MENCPMCGSEMVRVGEPCDVAVKSMSHVDYFGDGSRYVPIGNHPTGHDCPTCDFTDVEPCIHD